VMFIFSMGYFGKMAKTQEKAFILVARL
jgi:hypothetical protein